MDTLSILKAKLEENAKILAEQDAIISSATLTISSANSKKEEVLEENQHIEFTYNYLVSVAPVSTQTNIESNEKQTIGAFLLETIHEGESVTVDDAWNRVTNAGAETTKATVNTTLYNMEKKGIFEKVSLGVYKRPTKEEINAKLQQSSNFGIPEVSISVG